MLEGMKSQPCFSGLPFVAKRREKRGKGQEIESDRDAD